MKHSIPILKILLIYLVLTLGQVNAQTYINKEWVQNYGSPDAIEWSSTFKDFWGNINTIGNTQVSGQRANILITRFDNQGGIVWQSNWDGPRNGSEYGVDLVGDDNLGYIYAVGASNYTNDTSFDITLLKYDASGNLIWETSYDGAGKNDYPIKITMDDSGGLYVTGSSETSTTGFDFITLKFDTSGALIWDSRYDFNHHLDVAADILTDPTGSIITVTGGSEDSVGIWDYTTITYDMFGSEIDINREPAGNDIKKPRDIVRDNNGNYYITGVYNNGTDDDIKLIKLDSTLNTVWVSVYNNSVGGTNEESNALSIDENGYLYIGGWQQNPGAGERTFLILKFDQNGDFIWEQTLWPDENKPISEATDLNISGGYVNVIGFCSNSNNSDIVTARFATDDGELNFIKIWENSFNSIDFPTDIVQEGKDIYVTGRTTVNNGVRWVIVKYSLHESDTAMLRDSLGLAVLCKNQLIVRFDHNIVKKDVIDNTNFNFREFGLISDFLKDSASEAVLNKLQKFSYESNFLLLKIFKALRTTDTLTISRLNEPIHIPKFWATFVLELPEGNNINEVADSLNTLFPLIKYVHPNLVAIPESATNDSLYLDNQASLHPTTSFDSAHINIEPAWNITEAKPNIRVGIFDDGLFWKHKDFGYTGTASSSVIVGGWDFEKSAMLKSTDAVGSHGTPCAGIFGAIKNNKIGIAGISGRDSSDIKTGVSIYGIKIYPVLGPLYSNPLNYIADAIVETSIYDPNNNPALNYRYGLNVSNNSWRFSEMHPAYYTDTNLTLLNEAVHFANRLKVTYVAIRGNEGYPNKAYPGIIDDDWVLCVGGTGVTGGYKYAITGDPTEQWEPSYGPEVDVSAPATQKLIRTLGSSGGYQDWNGTSAAAPHVTGVVSLLMSYLNKSSDSYENLSPEDIEYILQMTATDVETIGPDNYTGHGRLNGGAALQAVKKGAYKLIHCSSDSLTNSKLISLYSSNQIVTLTERYKNYGDKWFKPGPYKVNTYKIDATVNYTIGSNDSIKAKWPRPSSSNLLPLFDVNKKLVPRERILLNTVNQNSASLTGYIYRVSDTLGNFLGWWPFDTIQIEPQFAYSLLLKNKLYGKISQVGKVVNNVKIFPNPCSQHQSINITIDEQESIEISLYDVSGRLVKAVCHEKVWPGEQSYNIDLGNLCPGIYIYTIKIGSKQLHTKVIKE
jgi:hypothetical protein